MSGQCSLRFLSRNGLYYERAFLDSSVHGEAGKVEELLGTVSFHQSFSPGGGFCPPEDIQQCLEKYLI